LAANTGVFIVVALPESIQPQFLPPSAGCLRDPDKEDGNLCSKLLHKYAARAGSDGYRNDLLSFWAKPDHLPFLCSLVISSEPCNYRLNSLFSNQRLESFMAALSVSFRPQSLARSAGCL
jgi:hypothetical protein